MEANRQFLQFSVVGQRHGRLGLILSLVPRLVPSLGLTVLMSFLTGFISVPAQALIELRGGYSYLNTNPKDINNSSTGLPELRVMNSVSADALASVVGMPLSLGVRYETFTAKPVATTTGQVESTWTRVSVLAGKRLMDQAYWIGPLATVGVSNDFKYKTTVGSTVTNYRTSGNISASLGLEAGVRLSILRVGLEAGYMYAPLGDLKNSSTGLNATQSDGTAVKADLSGPYARALVGFAF